MSARAITIRHPDDVHVNSFKNIIYSVMVYEYLIKNIFDKVFTVNNIRHNIQLSSNSDNIKGADIVIASEAFDTVIHYVDCKMYNYKDNTVPITWNRIQDDSRLTDSYAVIINDVCYWVSKEKLKRNARPDMFSYSEYTKSSHLIADFFKQLAKPIYTLSPEESSFLNIETEILKSITDEENNFEHVYEIFDKFKAVYNQLYSEDVLLNIAP